MKICCAILAATTLLATARAERAHYTRQLDEDLSYSDDESCPDPAGAVLALTQCVEAKDIDCVTGSYDPDFQAIHNEIPIENSFLGDNDVGRCGKESNCCTCIILHHLARAFREQESFEPSSFLPGRIENRKQQRPAETQKYS